MALKIFGDAPKIDREAQQEYADDTVGRFRSGYQIDGNPAALQEWRVTTGDPKVAEAIRELLDGGEVQTWEASGEDNLETFTKAPKVAIILDGPKAVSTRLILWSRQGKILYTTDGVTKTDADGVESPDPDAGLDLQERKQKAYDGIGPAPSIEIRFRLRDAPELGVFKFVSGSWGLLQDMHYYDTESELADVHADNDGGPVAATLALEEVSFVAKKGERKGKTVSFTKPVFKIKGAAA